ncbi:MMPL family transporter [Dongia soli]|uniref:MMPL family transporter n=1 Tax=Dongia soli TaxID=600628 RepID=A0ABU5E7D6_9PROT|nr:MMPL family transporter [Dongia soli]MDY0882211.1 MMPL family transporter [Dongia soli]
MEKKSDFGGAAGSPRGDRLIAAVIEFCTTRAWIVVLVAGLLTAGAFNYVATHFSIDTDSAKLISDKLPWRQRDAAFDRAFPQGQDQIVVVVDGTTPELAESATAALTARLLAKDKLFKTVRRPDGGSFFNRNGLLFLSKEEVTRTTGQLVAAQPLLGSLAADPSLRGLMKSLSLALLGVEEGEAKLDDLAPPLIALSNTLEGVLAGTPRPLSWRQLITNQSPDPRELRRFILVQPVLDYTALAPGGEASDAIRRAASELKLDPPHGVTIRLTGSVPLADEEFSTLADGAAVTGSVTLAAVIILLWFGLRSIRMIVSIMLTLMVGLLLTAAFGLAVIGPFNLISVAFAVLFVGLGVDFGIQYCVRYREERRRNDHLPAALKAAGTGVGRQLALAAVSIAAGFFAFLPTNYRGVSDLGLIAGTGMIIAFALNVTLLPALLRLTRPSAERSEVGYRFLKPADRLLLTQRRLVLVFFGLLGLTALGLLPWLRFDFNPINLKSPKVESVATLLDLMRDPNTTPNTIDVLAPSLKAAAAMGARLSQLPEVAQAVTLESFVPEEQAAKLASISDTAMLLGFTLTPADIRPPPSDPENIDAMAETAKALRRAASGSDSRRPAAKSSSLARHVADQLDQVATGTPGLRIHASDALVPGLNVLLNQLRQALEAEPVTLSSLPRDLVADWVASDGRARVQVFPKGDSNDNDTLRRFTAAVRAVAPEATGTPISIQESSRTIVNAFRQAALWATLSITILLVFVLRNIVDVLLTLAPLFLAGLLTLGTCVVIGQPINFANIIALPLLFGIGVAFNIYFVMAWRAGARNMLQSSLARAILFSALTTSTAFGSLWLSHHPGTASMGKVLVISLIWTLVTALIFLPALLGAPKKATRPIGKTSVQPRGAEA